MKKFFIIFLPFLFLSCGYIPILEVEIVNNSSYTISAYCCEKSETYTIEPNSSLIVDGIKNNVQFTFSGYKYATVTRNEFTYTINDIESKTFSYTFYNNSNAWPIVVSCSSQDTDFESFTLDKLSSSSITITSYTGETPSFSATYYNVNNGTALLPHGLDAKNDFFVIEN